MKFAKGDPLGQNIFQDIEELILILVFKVVTGGLCDGDDLSLRIFFSTFSHRYQIFNVIPS